MNPLLTEMEHRGLQLHGLHLHISFVHVDDVRTLTNDYSGLLQLAECVQSFEDVHGLTEVASFPGQPGNEARPEAECEILVTPRPNGSSECSDIKMKDTSIQMKSAI